MTFDPPEGKAEEEPGTFSHVRDLKFVGTDATIHLTLQRSVYVTLVLKHT